MQNFQVIFLFPTNGTSDRSQSNPLDVQAPSLQDAMRQVDALVERQTTHRTVDTAILTTSDDALMEITRWVRGSGWMTP